MALSSEDVVAAIAAPRKSVSVLSKVVSFCPCHLDNDRPRGGQTASPRSRRRALAKRREQKRAPRGTTRGAKRALVWGARS
jgi:hypothetical protein